jgi:DNA-nicking Smr family endonuclease
MADKNISDEDVVLFRTTVGKVARVHDDRARPPKPNRSPRPRAKTGPEPTTDGDMLSDYDHAEEPDNDLGALSFSRTGVALRTLKKLKRGQVRIQAELDLHGMTVAEAQHAFAQFLQESGELRIDCVRIIHGKGFGSKNGVAVIKTRLDRWLRMREEVLAFVSAQPVHGGTGAVYVLLKT